MGECSIYFALKSGKKRRIVWPMTDTGRGKGRTYPCVKRAALKKKRKGYAHLCLAIATGGDT